MRARLRLTASGALAAVALISDLGAAGGPTTAAVPEAGCDPAITSSARVTRGATASEPELYAAKDAPMYGVLKDAPRMPNGSVRVQTVFHVVSDHGLTSRERDRMSTMISAQVKVLNDAYAGRTAPDAADSPFRFTLARTTWTVDPAWSTVVPGRNERAMKAALYTGTSRTLNVYVANIGAGLLGWSYFPKDYNNGRDYMDGVVMLDESMPGGTMGEYAQGDTLTHEVGHWLMLEHTFRGACSARGDNVADTPREAVPHLDCPLRADTCSAPGLDPVHNFMDYTPDACMTMFTAGQVERMNDAWVDFRAGSHG
jgi:hypothetical protein